MSKQAEIANDRAIKYWKQNRFNDAIAQWEKAARNNPDIAEIPHNLGNAYAHQGQTEKAIESLKRAISIDPTLVEAYNKLGNIYYKQGNLDLAFAVWKHALKIKPDFKEALQNLRLIQNAMPLDVDNEIPTYQHGDEDNESEAYGAISMWKSRISQGLGKLLRKERDANSE